MIKKIMLENYLSIGEETLVFNPSENINIIYGENGAGKTNFFTALRMLKLFITKRGHLPNYQNKFIQKNSTKIFLEGILDENSSFEYLLLYRYTEENDIKIEQEQLILDGRVLFDREQKQYNLADIEEEMIKRDKTVAKKSILSKIVNDIENENKTYAEQLKSIYEWFEEQLIFLPLLKANEFGKMFMQDEKIKSRFLTLMERMNLPIFDVMIEEENRYEEMRRAIESLAENTEDKREKIMLEELLKKQDENLKVGYNVSFIHSNDVKVSYNIESSGTQKIVSHLLVMIVAEETNKKVVYFSDEFDNSLHYELSKFLLQEISKNNNVQFIGTTHNLIFLEQQEYGKKSFWFIEKDKKECTTIFSLSDIEGVRSDNRHNWRKLYQEYRFGAYPHVNKEG